MKAFQFSVFFSLLFFSCLLVAQSHKGKCGLEISKAYTQNVLGKNIGYYVEFKNNSAIAIDAIEWTAAFYNNFNELKGKRDGAWSSGNIINPIKPGDTTKDLETNWVKDATKVFIIIKRVHFADGKICK